MAALRGCLALLIGDRQAPTYFDFSQRGLLGSLIATVLGIGIAAFGPVLLGTSPAEGSASQTVIINLALFLVQAGMAWVALRQMGRQDGFVPYLVATNWVTFASALLLLVSAILGPLGGILLIVVVILAIASFVNIGRFVVTLAPLQIAMLFVVEAVGVFLAFGILVVMLAPTLPAA